MSGLLETQRAGKCDSEINRIWVVVKLHTIPCNIEFVFGISVSPELQFGTAAVSHKSHRTITSQFGRFTLQTTHRY